MDANEQIKLFQEFFETYYYSQVLENARIGSNFLHVDFKELTKFNIELADKLLEEPEELIKAAELAVKNFDLPKQIKKFNVRIINMPEEQRIKISDIRSAHLNKLMLVDGLIRQKSDVRPQVTTARFECPSCGNIINVLQLDTKFQEPTRCGCGRKGKFRLLAKELVDVQGIVLEESSKDLEGGEQPKRMNVLLKDDLVSPLSERKTNPGTGVRLVGILKEIPIITRQGTQSTRFDLIIEANSVESVEEDYTTIMITKEDEEEIKNLSKDPRLTEKLIAALAPGIFGYENIKEAMLLQFVGGVRKVRSDKVPTRGDMHILLVGDPGAGKSQLLKRAAVVAPKARYVSGKGVSGAGLTATVVKDEFLSGWSLEAGALVLANRGILMVDELDKMSPEDRSAMHEGLEQQTISISKANVQATLRCETTVLAAANPKLGRFDPYEPLAKQIDLPPALISRFDLIFTIKDLPDEKKDTQMASFILNLHQEPEKQEGEVSTSLLRKYLSYAKKNIVPKLTDAAVEELQEYYVKMRTGSSEDKAFKAIPITPRQLEALVRLSEASAKLRLSTKVSKKDAKKAVALLNYCLQKVSTDPVTGKIDIDMISTGVTTTERTKIIGVREIINELEQKLGKTIPIEEVVKAAAAKGIEEERVMETIEKLKRSGDIFQPKRDVIQKI